MPVRQSCNGSEWVVRALYDSQTFTYRVSEMYEAYLARTTRTHDQKPSNFRTVGERHASGLHESFAP
jgi:hypothetical protein